MINRNPLCTSSLGWRPEVGSAKFGFEVILEFEWTLVMQKGNKVEISEKNISKAAFQQHSPLKHNFVILYFTNILWKRELLFFIRCRIINVTPTPSKQKKARGTYLLWKEALKIVFFLGTFPKYVKFLWPLFSALKFTFLFLNLAKIQIFILKSAYGGVHWFKNYP